MSDLNKFEEAISRHIAADLYYAATINSKESAVAMAELDILSQTGAGVDKEDPVYIDAVAEQTIFLLLNIDKLYSPLNDVVSESVEGAGSVTYDKTPARIMSARALRLCCLLSKKTLPLARG
ncbi:MAG: hypothetical protein J6S54_01735 [Lentisphaeria bacterium]|jgi:hypothetical protein|nr:hypothetical protein [Lentisphaeria bacterium]